MQNKSPLLYTMPWIDAKERLPQMEVPTHGVVDFFLSGVEKAIIVRKTEDRFYCVIHNGFCTMGFDKLIKWWEDE